MESSRRRPFDFLVPFWGKRYTDYFTNLCLPSLLAPNNMLLLRSEDGHRFLMATTREDWAAIERLPIMERLRKHATPTLVEVESGSSSPLSADSGAMAQYTSVIRHQTNCLKRLFDEAYRGQSYGCLMSPDVIFSDQTVATMIRYVEAGYQFVMCPSLRQKEEPVRADLDRLGYLKQCDKPSLTGRSIDIPPRIAAKLFVEHLHPEMAQFEFASPKPTRPFISPFCYWRVPGRRGVILHEFFGVPIIMDYSSVRRSHCECLERDDYENVYLVENFFRDYRGRVGFVRDSDELTIISLTPAAADFSASTAHARNAGTWKPFFAQLRDIRDSMKFFVGQTWAPVRRDLFIEPFRIHTGDFDGVWAETERKARRIISLVVGDYRDATHAPTLTGWRGIILSAPRKLVFETAQQHAIVLAIRRKIHGVNAIASRLRVGILILSTMFRRFWQGLRGD